MKKSNYWKFILGFFGVILGVFILYIIGFSAYQAYEQWQGKKRVQQTAENLKQLEAADYAAAMADTYGGKTPQETLQMYIAAVEKGDYELASKYFIGDRQQEELKSSVKMSDVEMKKYIDVLNLAITKFDIDGRYDIEKQYFSLYKPIGIRMKFYPNGIWKIIEI